ncbi:Molybdopterin synthase catalytic subunit [Apostasia shenzhenica]|uniref:Molybdopterin synthase catalytic subunit n=1 Tax=Apostasia shenzhenica TaxID=1088818 RepID=A0A2I0A7A2_9ASPA|nr:Molybdopterin synthase catalytic subunit [Apostasia shenzhenica]
MAAGKGEIAADGDSDTLIEIVNQSSSSNLEILDLARYVSFVRDPAAGAIATFEGTTRDTFEGRRVIELRYEAYVPMAARRLSEACAAARSRWPLRRLAVAHRLGVVPVGDASVFIAASAVHRADAMDACRFIIDEIKASVPIWKKEVYADGEIWKENREFFERRPAMAAEQDKAPRCCGCGSKERVGIR